MFVYLSQLLTPPPCSQPSRDCQYRYHGQAVTAGLRGPTLPYSVGSGWRTPEKQLCVICLSSLSLHKYFLSTYSVPDLGDVMTDDKDESSILTKLVVEGVA